VGPVVKVLSDHVADDSWHEVTLLTVGHIGIVQQRDEAASAILNALIQAAPGEPGQAAVLAGQAVIDVWPGGVTPTCKAQVIGSLYKTMTDGAQVKSCLRAAAGDALAKLGDPRPEATTLEGMQFCYVPPGAFWMGEGKEQHMNQDLDYGYWMARYPLTVAQFQAFVEAGGYQEPRHWPEAQAAGVWQSGKVQGLWEGKPRDRPYELGEPFNLPNRPVVGVTWYEALAFCRWLTETWRATKRIDPTLAVRLPSEAEWEKAARGGTEIPASTAFARAGAVPAPYSRTNPNPRQSYPWGNDTDPNRANYDESGINTSSAVGCFPGGASPYGVEDLSGNVWEWCHSLYRPYPYHRDDGREDPKQGGPRVLRGGSFGYAAWGIRCTARSRDNPEDGYRVIGFRLVVAPHP
jgi:formylglycine-generating enzyme required for sulfatase activity